jgi:regulator of protease activity HflC (stomatin/prohibitin superfamily)
MAGAGDEGTDVNGASWLAGPGAADAAITPVPPGPEALDGAITPVPPGPEASDGAITPTVPGPGAADGAITPAPPGPGAADAAVVPTPVRREPSVPIAERAATSLPGWLMLWVALAGLVVGVVLATQGGSLTGVGAVVIAASGFLVGGLTAVAPGEARVVQLLGRYTGTIRDQGLQWVSPVTKRHKISTRVRNHETGVAKVNDVEGNPIEIAAVVVWQVADTAKALFGVDKFTSFVSIQAETAVRRVAGSYPYDSHDGKMSLLQNADEITAALAAEIADRVLPAGVEIIEARLTRLAYAPEIATAMLRRQQAGAVVAARQRIVDGAVGMVEAALDRLAADGAVELDEERKATMVSNLLVVLCSDHPIQPVINTGTLYQ